jgi:hypothetical protein
MCGRYKNNDQIKFMVVILLTTELITTTNDHRILVVNVF